MNPEEFRPIIEACDVDTLCVGFEYSQLCELYHGFTGDRVMQLWEKKDVAEALKKFVETGVKSLLDTSHMSVSELMCLSRIDLILIWEGLYGIKCRKSLRTEDIAWGIWNYHAEAARTADLTKNLR